MRRKVLIVEDQRNWQKLYTAILRPSSYDINIADNFEMAVYLLEQTIFDLAIVNVNLINDPEMPPDKLGIFLLQIINEQYPLLPRIVVTGDIGAPSMNTFTHLGVNEFLIKSRVDANKLLTTIEMVIGEPHIQLSQHNERAILHLLLQKLEACFDHDGIKQICFLLDIDYDNLIGENKRGKAISLIQEMRKMNQLSDLENECKNLNSRCWEE